MKQNVPALLGDEKLSVHHPREDEARSQTVLRGWLILLKEKAPTIANYKIADVLELICGELIERSVCLLQHITWLVRLRCDRYDDIVGKIRSGESLETGSYLLG